MFFFYPFKNIYNIYVVLLFAYISFFTKKQTNKDTISTLNIIHHQLGHWLSLIEEKKKNTTTLPLYFLPLDGPIESYGDSLTEIKKSKWY